MWIIGGWDGATYYNDVWNSVDGVTWIPVTTAPFSPRYTHGAVVFDAGSGPRMWVIGGYDGTSYFNDVWSSADGANWTQATADAGFAPRFYSACAVYQGRIWLYGGGIVGTYYPDVWSSANGATWQQESATTPFHPRIGHAFLAHDAGSGSRLWVVSGYGGSFGFQPDVWNTDDGQSWTLADGNVPFGARAGHTSLSFMGRLWVIAGFAIASGTEINDVWSAP